MFRYESLNTLVAMIYLIILLHFNKFGMCVCACVYIHTIMTNLFRSIINYLTSGPVVGLELLGENGITRWQLAGPENFKHAYSTTTSLLRTCGKNEIYNSVYGSKNIEMAMQV